ncbi:MAG: nucleotidyltransferase domain-containing protein [Candidatus Nanoarchaeia archaeon]|nr:nucleotidyltransferase domain-containing protein [Candidatus Nanoarchaeia archaeon]MDD5588269.1 nucleotidyltransferase domain-containing protein [Candidatus Nanoarchaeia archaeon]
MNLTNFLKKNKYSRKVFGERELKIIEKQLLGINLTQSEKNRLSRDIRKKFDFIKEVSEFSKEFDLKKGQYTKEIIEDAKEVILEDIFFNRIKKIILFGSFVINQLTFRSDIDIAVEFFDNINITEATLFRKRIYGKTDEKVDIQVYNILPDKIKKEIDSKGKILYERQNK